MDAWVWWLIVALLLGVAEVGTTSLVLGMLSGGALAALVVAAAGAPLALQLGTFAGASALLLLVVRPVAARHLRQPIALRSGVAALVGSEAVVLETVDGRSGRIKLSGEVWSARTYDGDSVVAVGAMVHVISIDGATALVAEN